ncbi:MAG: type IV secretory system conjugative DNA transfer family protein [Rickettsiales bacterium]|jgi:type IV secretion system protein VirD4|nr:type IV secretory system conjugative DNA transfer family protein [Rickettsiales bacterium]
MAEKFSILSFSGKGKGLKIFDSSVYKDHEKAPIARYFWNMRYKIYVWIGCALAFAAAFPLEHLWRYGGTPATWKWMGVYFTNAFSSFGLSVIAEIPAWIYRTIFYTDIMTITPLIPVAVFFILTNSILLEEFNPAGKDTLKEESSRKANDEDIKKMGLLSGFMMVLGYWKKKPLMMSETLSALCLAPPGTGKTQGVVLPTIFDSTSVSMIINDPKPELKQKSSAYRSKNVGPVFIMNWAGQDDPANGIYYPSWNPLSPSHVPFNSEERDLYIDSICATLIAEKASSSADPHWTIAGRAALSGLVNFMVSKIDKAKADDYFYARLNSNEFDGEDAALLGEYYTMMNDPNADAARYALANGQLTAMNYVHIGTWAKIPDNWLGREASFSMIMDWLNKSQVAIAEELENRKKQGDQMLMMADPMKDVFQDATNEAIQYGYAHRAVLELTQLANTPDKERGSIISTVLSGLSIFRNAAVKNRTSHSDFHFSDLRGMIDPNDGKMKPVTVYLSINQVDADALNPITAIFVELMSRFLIANPPNGEHAGQALGPTPVLFLLDEMPKMQKMQAIIQGPDIGRGQKVSYLIIGQDIHQIQEKYGADAAATIISTTAAKIVFRQNDPDTAKRFSDMMGEKVKEETKKDKDGKETKNVDRKPLYSPMDIMKLDAKKQLVIFQGFYNRPIEADYTPAYSDPRLSAFMAMGECPPLPEFLIPSHHAIMRYSGNPRVYDTQTKTIKELSAQ